MRDTWWLTAYRRLHPEGYIRLKRSEALRHLQKAYKITSYEIREQATSRLVDVLDDYTEWQLSIDDEKLFKSAKKIGVYVDEIEFTPNTQDNEVINYYFVRGVFGNELLDDKFRKQLRKAVRERTPSYITERNAKFDLWFKLMSLAIGLVGSLTALFAVLRK